MRKANLDVCIQFIGLLSVVGGLLFVGMEMRQTQQIALAAETSNRMCQVLIQTINTSSETGWIGQKLFLVITRNYRSMKNSEAEKRCDGVVGS